MTLEEFINDHLCPTGVVTAWDARIITTALRLGDTQTLAAKITDLANKTGIQVPPEFVKDRNQFVKDSS